jgi:hypothetical protein
VSYIPVEDMTADDWRWLDFETIRLYAKNQIAELAFQGDLAGFFDVTFIEKAHKAKPRYLYAASRRAAAEFEEDGPAPKFTHEPEVETESTSLTEFLLIVELFAYLSTASVVYYLEQLKENSDNEHLEPLDARWAASLRQDDLAVALAIIFLWEMTPEEIREMLDRSGDNRLAAGRGL